MSGSGKPSARADELRRAFDRSFAETPRTDAGAFEDLLTIRVGGDPYALGLAECAGLFADRKVTPLPTDLPELLGLAGFRGSLVPVYDLRALLGYPRRGSPRWLVTTGGRGASVALAFDSFEAHVRIALGTLVADVAPTQHLADRVVHLPDGVRRVLRVASILETIEARARSDRQGA